MSALQKIHIGKGDITTLPVEQVIFCTYSDPDFLIYQSEFARLKDRAN